MKSVGAPGVAPTPPADDHCGRSSCGCGLNRLRDVLGMFYRKKITIDLLVTLVFLLKFCTQGTELQACLTILTPSGTREKLCTLDFLP